MLLRTARSLTANPSDAEDLLQTALAKTYLAWERIQDHRALDGYVRRALVNTRTSQWRRRKVDEFACDELPEPDPLPSPDPAEQQAVRDAMWRAVGKLPARQRAMVVLRYYEDLSEMQTAEVLGVSVGTVKSAVSRALAKLREDAQLASDVLGASSPGAASSAAVSPEAASPGRSAGAPEAPGASEGAAAPAGRVVGSCGALAYEGRAGRRAYRDGARVRPAQESGEPGTALGEYGEEEPLAA